MNREQEIFSAAAERTSVAERQAYLDRACADAPEMRPRLEALLRAAEAAGGFLEELQAPVPEIPGARVGRYRLGERLGEGGFGVVYLAEQEEPVRRTVALKIIKLGMDTRAVIARFEAERQALAMMDHPNIARVFDAGATETGRPYFVMELVRGVPITTFCSEHRLRLRARLELFLQVCRAVHHAHQKGIIHRDLKPTNLLVTLQEGRPVAKVIDFGIAKATCDPLTEKTLVTRLYAFLGTPAYMSPEQVGLDNVDVDTRSDIYSLGALLYELLADSPALDVRAFQQQGYAAVQQAIHRVDPPPPSERVASLEATAKAAAASRRVTTPARMIAELRGDLDRIVLKCLEKDRARRYETTEDFAQDIQRFLRNEPVHARPATLGYRFTKFVKRNRRGVLVGAAATALLLGLGVYHARRLATERDRAQLESQKRAKVSEMLTELLTSSDPFRTPGSANAGPDGALDASADRVRREFATQFDVQEEILGAIGRVYLRLGQHDKARPLLEEALRAGRASGQPSVRRAQALSDLGVLCRERGDFPEAIVHFEEALALRRQLLGSENNEVAATLVELGRAQSAIERLDLAEPLFREALAIRQKVLGPDHRETATSLGDLGTVLWQKGDLAAAGPVLQQSLETHRRAVGPKHPNVGGALANVAMFKVDQNDMTTAEAMLRESLEIMRASLGPQHWRTANVMGSLGSVWRLQGKLSEAASMLDQAILVSRAAFGESRPAVAALEVERARVHLDLGENAAAEALLRAALRTQRLSFLNSGWRISTTKSLLGAALLAQHNWSEAEPLLVEAAQALKEIPGPQGRETRPTQVRLAELARVRRTGSN